MPVTTPVLPGVGFPQPVISPSPSSEPIDSGSPQWLTDFVKSWFDRIGSSWDSFKETMRDPIGGIKNWITKIFTGSASGDSNSGGSVDDILQHLVDSESGTESLFNSKDPGEFLKGIAQATGDDAWLEKYTDFLIDKYFMDANNAYNTEMANTSFSRLMNDIKSSGYNPWLALQSSIGQSSYTGSSGMASSHVSSSSQRTSRENNTQDNITGLLRSVVSIVGLLLLKR